MAGATSEGPRGQLREAALFTHRGLSGPSILQVSSYWRHGDAVSINFMPEEGPGWLRTAKREEPRTNLRRLLARTLPDRLAITLSGLLRMGAELGQTSDSALDEAERQLANWQFNPKGTEGFAKAEVTIGGISTTELSSRTMESRRVPCLFAIGEAVDVTGWLGGYNFQWAWASAFAAAQAI